MRNSRSKVSDARRFSVLQEDLSICYFCGGRATDKHEIFCGTANRQKSKDYGLVVGLCRAHHEIVHRYPKGECNRILRIDGQMKFEETHSREEFIAKFGKSYL